MRRNRVGDAGYSSAGIGALGEHALPETDFEVGRFRRRSPDL